MRREQPAHKPLIRRAMVAEVPLAGPSFGRVVTGLLAKTAIELVDAEGKQVTIQPQGVSLSLGSPVRAIHMLVRLVYADGAKEDHPLINGEHIADYIRRIDVPKSEFAFDLDGRQLRYLRVQPQRPEPIAAIDLVKGTGSTAPVVMAITLEMP